MAFDLLKRRDVKVRSFPFLTVGLLAFGGAFINKGSAQQCDLGYHDAAFAHALGLVTLSEYHASLNVVGWSSNGTTQFYWGEAPNTSERLYITAAHTVGTAEITGKAVRYLQTPRIYYDGCSCVGGFYNDTSVDQRIHQPSLSIYHNLPIFTGRVDPTAYSAVNMSLSLNAADIVVRTPLTQNLAPVASLTGLKLDFYPVAVGEEVWIAGYPEPSLSPWTIQPGLHFTVINGDCNETIVTHAVDRNIRINGATSPGMSGSPLIRASSGGVIGVMVGEGVEGDGVPIAHSVREILRSLQTAHSADWMNRIPVDGYIDDPSKEEPPLPWLGFGPPPGN